MLLPGRLKDTTLGDVFGKMIRARATGTLLLVEIRPTAGRTHSISFENGRIVDIGTSLGPTVTDLLSLHLQSNEVGSRRIGDALIENGRTSIRELKIALHEQLRRKVDSLFSILDAEIRFRVPRPRSEDASRPAPLEQSDFLTGRPRAKLRSARTLPPPSSGDNEPRSRALRTLGLGPNATRAEIQSAFRQLALSHHPDRLAHPSEPEKIKAIRKFAEISSAYHALTA